MTDRSDPHAATLASIDAHRRHRRARAYESANGRVNAARRALTELLHPALAAGLTREQSAKVREARDIVESITGDLSVLAGVNPPLALPAAPPVSSITFTNPPPPPPHMNVIPLRRRDNPLIRL